MRVPYSWLTEYVPASPSVAETADLLTMSGTKVEAVHAFGVPEVSDGNGAGFRVGRVLSYEQHPNADRLRLCKVDVGDGEPRQIICGASNFNEGDTVAVVLPGSIMPGGMKIKKAKLRGVESQGMMLSERELELSQEHDGIMLLPAEWAPGEPLAERLPLGDTVIELELTPNRPDCLGVLGVAREVAAVANLSLRDPLTEDVEATAEGTVADHLRVQIEAPELCARYMARALVDAQIGPSPPWLRSRLAAAGMRSINNVVDVTNYVMLTTGQPLHAFDAQRIRGKIIVVRRAATGETVTTLDGTERSLSPETLCIADAEGTLVIAGIMGAADAEVTQHTTSIVLEAASFDGPAIQRASMRLGLRSESSARFEKGLDPHAPEAALRMASRLLVELCGARLVPGTIDERAPQGLDAPAELELELELAPRILGTDVPEEEQRGILERLGYGLSATVAGSVRVQVPSWRMYDTTRPIDLVEEIGRVWGMDRIPATMPARRSSAGGGLSAVQRLGRLLEDTCAGLGFHETMTYTLVGAGVNEQLGLPADSVVRLTNPMTAEHAELRGALLPSLLDVARHNRTVGADDVALFELGRTYARAEAGAAGADDLPRYAREQRTLGLLACGAMHGGRFDSPPIRADLPALAGVVEALLRTAALSMELVPADPAPEWLHPGQAARVLVRGAARDAQDAGWIGTLHPALVSRSDLRGDVVAAELDVDVLGALRAPVLTYTEVGQFPPVVQDIAVALPTAVLAGPVVDCARAAGGPLLQAVEVFDRYEGEHVEVSRYSLALRLTFRAADRTLTDDEVSAVRAKITEVLTAEFDARLRG